MKHKTAYIGIGTNKGNRKKNISQAIWLLKNCKNIKLVRISKMLKNPPQEGIKSGYFLNGALKIKTTLPPQELLKVCKEIEKKLGRIINKKYKKKKSRIIDLDILLYENKVINSNNLTIPHKKMHLRDFVLIPLLELGKNIKHPVFKKTIFTLAKTS